MRVLRLSGSQDVTGPTPEPLRAWFLAARLLEHTAGAPVETLRAAR